MVTKINELKKALENNGINAELTTATKNGVTLQAVRLDVGGQIFPQVYYSESEEVKTIIDRCKKALEIEIPDFQVEKVNCYEEIKDSLFLAVISEERTESGFSYVSTEFNGIATYVYIRLGDSYTIKVSDNILNLWGKKISEVWEDARNNSASDISIEKLADFMEKATGQDFSGMPDIYIVSNTTKIRGAVSMLFREEIEKQLGINAEDFYIIPSSIHEVLFVPKFLGSKEDILEMNKFVNSTEVAEEDLLIDGVYEY